MHDIYTLHKDKNELPFLLNQINDPPDHLFVKGKLPNKDARILCIVGARRHSSYGQEVCRKLIAGLRGYNICIVSGLALGIDSLAHKNAMENGLHTIAFPGSGLDEKVLYPYQNRKLANEIIKNGGGLISEFKMNQPGALWTFPKRNRLMAGISHAVLVIEAELVSGTLITSRLATEYNRDVGAVPGQIFSPIAEGPNMLLSLGAKIIRSSDDVLELLGLPRQDRFNQKQRNLFSELNENERQMMEILEIEPHNHRDLLEKMNLPIRDLQNSISNLELQGLIEEKGGVISILRKN